MLGSRPVIVGIDFSVQSTLALSRALSLAEVGNVSELYAVAICEADGLMLRLPGSSHYMSQVAAHHCVQRHVELLIKQHVASGGRLACERVVGRACAGDPATVLLRLSEEIAARLIIVGSRGQNDGEEKAMGSVAETIVKSAVCGVYIERASLRAQPGRQASLSTLPPPVEAARHGQTLRPLGSEASEPGAFETEPAKPEFRPRF